MISKDISFDTPEENILFDEVLLHLAEQGESGEVLRFWESNRPFVVLGKISKDDDDIKLGAVENDDIPILRRCSGGGTVLQGRGCLNYALILSKEKRPQIKDLRKSYEYILNKIVSALKQLGVESSFKPISDIALDAGKMKISGNSQKRAKRHILHHGTILYDFGIDLMERYLNIPREIPEYRKGRHHCEFVSNIFRSAEDIKKVLSQAFQAKGGASAISESEKRCLGNFLETKKLYSDVN